MRVLPTVLLLAGLALSGCLDSTPAETDDLVEEVVGFVNPAILASDGHDHADLSAHTVRNAVERVGHSYLGEDGPPGRIGEIDVAGQYAFAALFDVGFGIIDLSDPAAPELMSVFEMPGPMPPTGHYTADLKVDATGDWVFLAMELSPYAGALIVDTRDKANSVVAGFWAVPGLLAGCHMVEYAVIDEQEILFCAPLDNAVYVGLLLPPVDTAAGPVREVAQVARWVPDTPEFVQAEANNILFRLQNQDPSAITHLVSGHQDMTFQEDPLTGQAIITVSFWNLGLHFVDVSIPAAPRGIGTWMGDDSDNWRGVLHTSMTFKSQDAAGADRRIAVTIPEGANPPALFVLDATDLSEPLLISEWAAHEDFQGQSYTYSMHNFQIVDGRIYIMMYHGGLGIFDVSTPENQTAPVMLGSYVPWDRAGGDVNDTRYGRGCCSGSWDVIVYQGYAVMANGGGIYVVRYDGDVVGPDAPSSFA